MPCRKLIFTNWFPAWLKIEYFLFTLSIFFSLIANILITYPL